MTLECQAGEVLKAGCRGRRWRRRRRKGRRLRKVSDEERCTSPFAGFEFSRAKRCRRLRRLGWARIVQSFDGYIEILCLEVPVVIDGLVSVDLVSWRELGDKDIAWRWNLVAMKTWRETL